jgi:hypothetical protein
MKKIKSISGSELIDFVKEVRAFIAALNRGATAAQLKKIKDRIRVRKPQEILQVNHFVIQKGRPAS